MVSGHGVLSRSFWRVAPLGSMYRIGLGALLVWVVANTAAGRHERFVDKLRTLFAVFWTLIGVLVLYAIFVAFLYQFGVEQYATGIRQ